MYMYAPSPGVTSRGNKPGLHSIRINLNPLSPNSDKLQFSVTISLLGTYRHENKQNNVKPNSPNLHRMKYMESTEENMHIDILALRVTKQWITCCMSCSAAASAWWITWVCERFSLIQGFNKHWSCCWYRKI